jgi:hypothetical protein
MNDALQLPCYPELRRLPNRAYRPAVSSSLQGDVFSLIRLICLQLNALRFRMTQAKIFESKNIVIGRYILQMG